VVGVARHHQHAQREAWGFYWREVGAHWRRW
jgi:hypothetical protein